MQSSLFEEGGGVVAESLDEVNAEIFEQGKTRYPNRTFILGTGPANAEIMIVGESPGPPDVATGKPFFWAFGRIAGADDVGDRGAAGRLLPHECR